MYEEFDFLDDLDDKGSVPRDGRQAIFDAWQDALESKDLKQISEALDLVNVACVSVQKQMSDYNLPETRKPWQTKEWYPSAVRARDNYSSMYRRLDRHRRLVEDERLARKERRAEEARRIRLREHHGLLLRQARLKILLKVLTIKASMERDRQAARRFADLVKERQLLDDATFKSLWDEVNAGGIAVTEREKECQGSLEKYRQKLDAAHQALLAFQAGEAEEEA